jgi:hypothetical protein
MFTAGVDWLCLRREGWGLLGLGRGLRGLEMELDFARLFGFIGI